MLISVECFYLIFYTGAVLYFHNTFNYHNNLEMEDQVDEVTARPIMSSQLKYKKNVSLAMHHVRSCVCGWLRVIWEEECIKDIIFSSWFPCIDFKHENVETKLRQMTFVSNKNYYWTYFFLVSHRIL